MKWKTKLTRLVLFGGLGASLLWGINVGRYNLYWGIAVFLLLFIPMTSLFMLGIWRIPQSEWDRLDKHDEDSLRRAED